MTELNYLDCARSYSLKVFETLIFCLGDQQMDQEMADLDDLGNEQKSALDLDSLVNTQQSDVPQSLSKFYAGLREVYPKKKKPVSQDLHVNMINIFLCVAFLCVSKEADADRDSANDSEDTSGYDSTASEPLNHSLPCLSPETLTLPSLEHIHRAADIWSMCRWIYLYSSVFQRQFHRLGGFEVCHRLIAMIIQRLSKKVVEQGEQERCDSLPLIPSSERDQLYRGSLDENLDSAKKPEWVSCDHSSVEHIVDGTAASRRVLIQENEWSLQGIRLLEALLAICLHSANNFQQKMEMESLLQVMCN